MAQPVAVQAFRNSFCQANPVLGLRGGGPAHREGAGRESLKLEVAAGRHWSALSKTRDGSNEGAR